MAIDWGAYNGHLRVGIDAVISPSSPSHSDTTVDCTWKFYVDSDGWNFNDTETLHYSGDGFGTIDNTFNNNSSGGSILVGTHKETYGISYNSGSKSAQANLTGAYNGATPSNSHTVNLPNRPIAAPSAGEDVAAGSVTSNGVTLTWQVPNDDGGDAVDNYEVQISAGSGFASPIVDHTMGNTTRSYATTALAANTGYYARVRAHNSAGWGDWTSSTFCHFTTLAGLPGTPGTPIETARTTTSLSIGWGASAQNGGGTVTYTAQISTTSTFTTILQTYTGTATSTTFTALTANTTYYMRVRGTNSLGTSPWTPTLTHATAPVSVYTDSGDYVTLVNNLASAVADKLVHLGITMWRGKTGSTTVPSGTDTAISMGTLIATRGPDAPTYSGNLTNNADYVIAYPGVYEIEFAFRFDEAVGSRQNLYIYINGVNSPSSTSPKGGIAEGFAAYGANAAAPLRSVRITRRLDVGDTVGWGIWQGTGAAQPAPAVGNLYAWGKVTLVGF